MDLWTDEESKYYFYKYWPYSPDIGYKVAISCHFSLTNYFLVFGFFVFRLFVVEWDYNSLRYRLHNFSILPFYLIHCVKSLFLWQHISWLSIISLVSIAIVSLYRESLAKRARKSSIGSGAKWICISLVPSVRALSRHLATKSIKFLKETDRSSTFVKLSVNPTTHSGFVDLCHLSLCLRKSNNTLPF